MSSRPSSSTAACTRARGCGGVRQIGGYGDGPAPARADLLRDGLELVGAPRRDHHVRAGLRQRPPLRRRARGPRR
ncbi:hypothetical protein [Nocardioides sp. B-3]|uniref:hypothetical protein n=1 Tax=Nocardioides sp. B-3 TaxID=2895565 RepID=UPI002153852C|nr:hypothetical protein [Nocardioides sp. B-3]UUZ60827.1 hypothetical protein LP418_08840 [Nocardioides sp. B-3]